MAKTKRNSGEAKDFNDDFEASRQNARSKSRSIVPISGAEELEKTLSQIRQLTADFAKLKAQGKAINEQRKAVLERIDAAGLDRHEFKALSKLLEVDEDKRSLKARTRQLFLKAHNLPEQADLFGAADDDDFSEVDRPGGVDGGVAAAIESGWLDEQRSSHEAVAH